MYKVNHSNIWGGNIGHEINITNLPETEPTKSAKFLFYFVVLIYGNIYKDKISNKHWVLQLLTFPS